MEVSDQVPTLQNRWMGEGREVGAGGSIAMRHGGCPSLILLAAKVFGCTLEL